MWSAIAPRNRLQRPRLSRHRVCRPGALSTTAMLVKLFSFLMAGMAALPRAMHYIGMQSYQFASDHPILGLCAVLALAVILVHLLAALEARSQSSISASKGPPRFENPAEAGQLERVLPRQHPAASTWAWRLAAGKVAGKSCHFRSPCHPVCPCKGAHLAAAHAVNRPPDRRDTRWLQGVLRCQLSVSGSWTCWRMFCSSSSCHRSPTLTGGPTAPSMHAAMCPLTVDQDGARSTCLRSAAGLAALPATCMPLCPHALPAMWVLRRWAAMGVCRSWRARIKASAELRPTVRLGLEKSTDEPALSLDAYLPVCERAHPDPPGAATSAPIVAGSAGVRTWSMLQARLTGCMAHSVTREHQYRGWLLSHLPAGLISLEMDFGTDAGLLRQLPRFTRLRQLSIGGSCRAFAADGGPAVAGQDQSGEPLPPLACPAATLQHCVPHSVKDLR